MTYEIMKHIVSFGANITITRPISDAILRDLVVTAKKSGAHVTVRGSRISDGMLRELAALGKNHVTFLYD